MRLVQRDLVFMERLCCWSEVTESPACRLGSTGGRMTSLVVSNRGTVHPSTAPSLSVWFGLLTAWQVGFECECPLNSLSREGGRCC